MTVKQCAMPIFCIDNKEITRCPPAFDDAQKLINDEIVDILLFSVPQSWQQEMDRQGFDPLNNAPDQVIDFVEQIEMS